MGEKSVKSRYHTFSYTKFIDIVVVEVIKNRFVWLSFFLDNRLRNKQISKEIVKYVLYKLRGEHHIHWFPEVLTFSHLSKELKWVSEGRSEIFKDCKATRTYSINRPPSFAPLFNVMLKYSIKNNCPHIITHMNKKETKQILANICEKFKTEI